MTKVFLHVGAPKSGTTYLQDIFFHHRRAMEDNGVLYPGERFDEHFLAAVDLQDLAFYGVPRHEAAGYWERVAHRARTFHGNVVISHDVFAGATEEQACDAVHSLRPAEVHVVYTARDLVRQVPSQWHEDIKHGRRVRFAEYLDELVAPQPTSEASTRFWRTHSAADVLARWGASLPPQRVHVVTVSRSEAPQTLLWERFAGLVGLDPTAYDLSGVGRANRALGVAETELLRRVNLALNGRMGQVDYEHVVKGILAHRILDERPGAVRIVLPPDRHAWFAERSSELVEALREAAYDVVGDLAELMPAPPVSVDTYRHPDEATEAEVAAVGVDATAELMLEVETLREAARRDAEELARRGESLRTLEQRLDAAERVIREHDELPDIERVKRTVVEIGMRNPRVEKVLGLYRRTRGSGGPSDA